MVERPVGTVRVAGLDPRDLRVIGFVLRHCDFNRFAYRIEDGSTGAAADLDADVVLANRHDPAGANLWVRADPVVSGAERVELLPPGAVAAGGDVIALDRLAVQLLPVLNRVFERRLALAQAAGDETSEADEGLAGQEAEAFGEELVERFAEDLADELADELDDELTDALPDELASELGDKPRDELGDELGGELRGTLGDAHANEVANEAGDEVARVLIVDDSATVRRQIGVALDRLGLRHEAVGSAAQALEKLAAEPFDLALVDVMMPDTDGYRLTRQIRRDPRVRHLPVIILTSRSSPFDLARGALAGCDAYLTKPVPFRALEAAVLKQLHRGGRTGKRKPRPLPDAGGPDEASQGASSSRLSRLLGR